MCGVLCYLSLNNIVYILVHINNFVIFVRLSHISLHRAAAIFDTLTVPRKSMLAVQNDLSQVKPLCQAAKSLAASTKMISSH